MSHEYMNKNFVVGPIRYQPNRGFYFIIIIISSRYKPIVDKQPHSRDFSSATHIKYRFRKLMTRTIQWWPRDDTDKDTHKDKYEDKDKDIQEESLPIYISLRILSSNEYI